MGLNPQQPWRIWPEETRRLRTRRLSPRPSFLSVTRPQPWVGWPAVLVEGGREEAKEVKLNM